MARTAFQATLGGDLGEGRFNSSVGALAPVLTQATTADDALATVVGDDQTAVEDAIAVLEADAASPTQAHVNSLRTVWDTLKTDAAIAKTATALAKTNADGPDVILDIDLAVVTSRNAIRYLLRRLTHLLEGSGL